PAPQGPLRQAAGHPHPSAERLHLLPPPDDRPGVAAALVAPLATLLASLRGGEEEEGSPWRRRPTPQSSTTSARPRPPTRGRSPATRIWRASTSRSPTSAPTTTSR